MDRLDWTSDADAVSEALGEGHVVMRPESGRNVIEGLIVTVGDHDVYVRLVPRMFLPGGELQVQIL